MRERKGEGRKGKGKGGSRDGMAGIWDPAQLGSLVGDALCFSKRK